MLCVSVISKDYIYLRYKPLDNQPQNKVGQDSLSSEPSENREEEEVNILELERPE